MGASQQDHVAFWRTLCSGMDAGQPLVRVLEQARTKLSGTPLEEVTRTVIQNVNAGSTLSKAMNRHKEFFSASVRTMVRAGEAGGVLDVVARRIEEGIKDGSFPLPGAERPAEGRLVRFWRAFGRLLSSGVPILEALDIVGEESADDEIRRASQAIVRTVRDGGAVSEALSAFPDMFGDEVRAAVILGEEKGELDKAVFRIADAVDAGDVSSLVDDAAMLEAARGKDDEDAAPVKTVNLIIREAIKRRASDIHLDPTEDGRGRVRLRVDGVLHDIEPPPAGTFRTVVSRIKIMAAMDIAERRLPQDGRIMLKVEGKPCDLRVSSVPAMWGERIVMRILDREAVILDLERIGFLEDELDQVRALCHLPNGTIICNGPTGSGKTTLLYAMLNEVNRDTCCVMSVEDPVEYNLEGVAQIQIRPRLGLTFARALRSVMRQDPDVVMIGEIRDLETAHVCTQVSLTGHLLMTTLHADTSPGAVKRLLDIGIEPFLVNSTLAAAISQRLVRRLCKECRQEAKPSLHSLPPEAVAFVREHGRTTFYGPKGCDTCHGTGYRGRIAIHEILVPDEGFRQSVSGSADLTGLRQAAVAAGMRPMITCGLEKAARGITSIEEVCRVAPRGPNV